MERRAHLADCRWPEPRRRAIYPTGVSVQPLHPGCGVGLKEISWPRRRPNRRLGVGIDPFYLRAPPPPPLTILAGLPGTKAGFGGPWHRRPLGRVWDLLFPGLRSAFGPASRSFRCDSSDVSLCIRVIDFHLNPLNQLYSFPRTWASPSLED